MSKDIKQALKIQSLFSNQICAFSTQLLRPLSPFAHTLNILHNSIKIFSRMADNMPIGSSQQLVQGYLGLSTSTPRNTLGTICWSPICRIMRVWNWHFTFSYCLRVFALCLLNSTHICLRRKSGWASRRRIGSSGLRLDLLGRRHLVCY